MRETEQGQPGGQRQIGDRQHLASADQIDLPPDPRPEQCRNHQRGRECRKYPVRGNAEIAGDRIGQNRGQVIARGPRQRLRGAERQDDGEGTRAHRRTVTRVDQ